ncbi:MAG TPA: HU family DNA-binding protein [Candidatus Acidoferrales bacterium]|nr:HU family DNA-binding protein [Candidatus Acidoferrales bacterium]
MSVTKADIVEEIALQTGLTKIETMAVVEGFLASVRNSLAEGKTIEIRGFGSFKIRKRKGRMARNPKTGQAYPVKEQFVPYFKVSKEFKAFVDEHLGKNIPVEKETDGSHVAGEEAAQK